MGNSPKGLPYPFLGQGRIHPTEVDRHAKDRVNSLSPGRVCAASPTDSSVLHRPQVLATVSRLSAFRFIWSTFRRPDCWGIDSSLTTRPDAKRTKPEGHCALIPEAEFGDTFRLEHAVPFGLCFPDSPWFRHKSQCSHHSKHQ